MTTLLPPNVKVHLALGFIDMRKGIDGLSEADKQQILQEAMRPDAGFCKVARRYGIAERVLFR
jgi:transposase-like protein